MFSSLFFFCYVDVTILFNFFTAALALRSRGLVIAWCVCFVVVGAICREEEKNLEIDFWKT